MPLDPTTLPDCLQGFTPEELHNKIEGIIEDWGSPTLSPIGLCRTHQVTMTQIRAIMALPMFAAIMADIRFIQDARREYIERKAADLALDRLCYLAHQTPTSAASCKEIRLATKAILELVAPVGPTSSRPSDPSVTPPMQSADSPLPLPLGGPAGEGRGESSSFYPLFQPFFSPSVPPSLHLSLASPLPPSASSA